MIVQKNTNEPRRFCEEKIGSIIRSERPPEKNAEACWGFDIQKKSSS